MSVRPLEFLKKALTGRVGCSCDTCPMAAPGQSRTVMLVGSPNVGKSVIFNSLTGRYAVVSNYPGTTVDYSKGYMLQFGRDIELIDVPGTFSLEPKDKAEEVAVKMLRDNPDALIICVIDAAKIERGLYLVLEFMGCSGPHVLRERADLDFRTEPLECLDRRDHRPFPGNSDVIVNRCVAKLVNSLPFPLVVGLQNLECLGNSGAHALDVSCE